MHAGAKHVPLASLVSDKLVAVLRPPADLVGILSQAGARDVLVLDAAGPGEPQRLSDRVVGRYQRPSDIMRNNCEVAILHGIAAIATSNKRYFCRLSHVLVARDLSMLAVLPGLLRYGSKGRLKIIGETVLAVGGRQKRYVVLAVNVPSRDQRRQFGPTGLAPLDLMRRLEGVDYVVLRWVEDIESGRHKGDIDVLVRGPSIQLLKEKLRERAGTYPIDVYSDDGRDGHTYKSVPYFVPAMASKILDSAVSRPSGVRVPSDKWRYLLFAYHLMFQNKSEGVPPGQESLEACVFPSPKYLEELARLARLAGVSIPRTFSDIERALAEDGVMPGIDLIGFYSARNPFLQQRYLKSSHVEPGIAVFYVREFGQSLEKVDTVRQALLMQFEILAEGPLSPEQADRVIRNVRGGNWHDPQVASGVALPIYWFVCLDHKPKPPSYFSRRKYPRLDNENIRVKDRIRETVGTGSGKPLRIIHSSDNTKEAIEHVHHLGLEERPNIQAAVLQRVRP